MIIAEEIIRQEKYKELKNLVLICEAMEEFAEAYHQEKMKQHDALVKMMAQDEKEGNYEEKCCILQTTFCNIGLDDICVNCGKNITPSPLNK